MIVIYILIAFIATTIGSLTGMGGGVIIKPVMDMVSDFPVDTIGVISSITVFSMAVVSIIKFYRRGKRLELSLFMPIAIGSVTGGFLGQFFIELLTMRWKMSQIKVIQNSFLLVLILMVFFYMKYKPIFKGNVSKNTLVSLGVGFLLGLFSSFLGIGGGPINIVAFLYIYEMDIKKASIASLASILFSQSAKLIKISIGIGFHHYNLDIVPYMVFAAIIGAQFGGALTQYMDGEKVERSFVWTQFLILLITLINIGRNVL